MNTHSAAVVRALGWLLSALSLLLPFKVIAQPAASACSGLTTVSLPETTISSAVEVTGGSFTAQGSPALSQLPPFCRVSGVTRPAIQFEVWLPLAKWNGKLQGVGNGANAGSISYVAMAEALRRGYAVASTDTGHHTTNSRDATWALGHPQLVIDLGYRSIHVTTQNAQQIVRQFYRRAATHSYFVACSTGGRQALMEAQRYPQDYDGIIAGAPAINWARLTTGGHMWVASAVSKDPQSWIPPSKLKLLGDAVNRACDKLDGIADGILSDPRKCHFDPRNLECRAGQDGHGCLTAKQVQAIDAIWSGSHTAQGKLIYPGYMRGAEAAGGWQAYMSGTGPMTGNHWAQATNVLQYMVFEDPAWNFHSFEVGRDSAFAERKLGKIFDAFDPDLRRFRDRGGKLILYHGWNDPSISPLNTINYYQNVISFLKTHGAGAEAAARAEDFARLFMVPGMLHCTGGPGPNKFDMVSALEDWVEQQRPPERIIASHFNQGEVDRTRPLCAYPQAAVYTGNGSTDDAHNFECKTPG